jgi:hypothetical protein
MLFMEPSMASISSLPLIAWAFDCSENVSAVFALFALSAVFSLMTRMEALSSSTDDACMDAPSAKVMLLWEICLAPSETFPEAERISPITELSVEMMLFSEFLIAEKLPT